MVHKPTQMAPDHQDNIQIMLLMPKAKNKDGETLVCSRGNLILQI